MATPQAPAALENYGSSTVRPATVPYREIQGMFQALESAREKSKTILSDFDARMESFGRERKGQSDGTTMQQKLELQHKIRLKAIYYQLQVILCMDRLLSSTRLYRYFLFRDELKDDDRKLSFYFEERLDRTGMEEARAQLKMIQESDFHTVFAEEILKPVQLLFSPEKYGVPGRDFQSDSYGRNDYDWPNFVNICCAFLAHNANADPSYTGDPVEPLRASWKWAQGELQQLRDLPKPENFGEVKEMQIQSKLYYDGAIVLYGTPHSFPVNLWRRMRVQLLDNQVTDDQLEGLDRDTISVHLLMVSETCKPADLVQSSDPPRKPRAAYVATDGELDSIFTTGAKPGCALRIEHLFGKSGDAIDQLDLKELIGKGQPGQPEISYIGWLQAAVVQAMRVESKRSDLHGARDPELVDRRSRSRYQRHRHLLSRHMELLHCYRNFYDRLCRPVDNESQSVLSQIEASKRSFEVSDGSNKQRVREHVELVDYDSFLQGKFVEMIAKPFLELLASSEYLKDEAYYEMVYNYWHMAFAYGLYYANCSWYAVGRTERDRGLIRVKWISQLLWFKSYRARLGAKAWAVIPPNPKSRYDSGSNSNPPAGTYNWWRPPAKTYIDRLGTTWDYAKALKEVEAPDFPLMTETVLESTVTNSNGKGHHAISLVASVFNYVFPKKETGILIGHQDPESPLPIDHYYFPWRLYISATAGWSEEHTHCISLFVQFNHCHFLRASSDSDHPTSKLQIRLPTETDKNGRALVGVCPDVLAII
ncbi:hypothetical protein BJ508DRAFT_303275 [Ascobolus immersus RN42]|uniref:Uncharacterized protein n=1 Tax=Ascobolus immersus RN42 TaxID=1160509 RepID=A0A3N4IFG4_ASCIM|nr:hypothetical protein BJ508DRAFT_303275 [Ascobolus immersus RN42]